MGRIEVSSSIACSLSYWNELGSKKEEETLICIDGICDNKYYTLPELNPRSEAVSPAHKPHAHSHFNYRYRGLHASSKIVERYRAARNSTVELVGGRSFKITLSSISPIGWNASAQREGHFLARSDPRLSSR